MRVEKYVDCLYTVAGDDLTLRFRDEDGKEFRLSMPIALVSEVHAGLAKALDAIEED